MKLRFHISRTVKLEPQIINGLILLKLKDNGYRVQDVTTKSIAFDDNPWRPRWNFENVRRLDGGKFEIDPSGDSVTITLSYYISLTVPILILAMISVGAMINEDYYAPLFFLLFYIIVISIRAIISKDVANSILDEMFNEQVMN